MYVILGILVFIIVLGLIVLIHEGGHFIFAKQAGILCHEFSIGMGPVICQKKKGETMYSIRAIPFGGYVAMAGEDKTDNELLKGFEKVKIELDDNGKIKTIILCTDNPKYEHLPLLELEDYDLVGTKEALEDELFMTVKNEDGVSTRYVVARDCMLNITKKESVQIAPYDRTFTNKPLFNRFISVFAGPLMNFVLAVIVFFIIGLIYGYADTSTTKVKDVSGPALSAGIENNDTLLAINDATLSDWNSLGAELSDLELSGKLDKYGALNIRYLSSSENKEKTTTVYPQIMVYAIEMVLKTQDINNPTSKVIIGDYGTQMEKTKIAKAGLHKDDEIYEIIVFENKNDKIGKTYEIDGIDTLVNLFTHEVYEEAKQIQINVKRVSDNYTETIKSERIETYSHGMLDTQEIPNVKAVIGVSTGTTKKFGKIIGMPFVETGKASLQIFKTLALFTKKNSGVKVTDLSGPLGIVNLFTQLVQGNNAFYNVLYWTGLLSVNIGLINLLPLPALDGGRLCFLLYEFVTRKKASPKVENTIHNIGFILLMGLFVLIFISDFIKCF